MTCSISVDDEVLNAQAQTATSSIRVDDEVLNAQAHTSSSVDDEVLNAQAQIYLRAAHACVDDEVLNAHTQIYLHAASMPVVFVFLAIDDPQTKVSDLFFQALHDHALTMSAASCASPEEG